MKTAREIIKEIKPIQSNLEYIAIRGEINGSLLESLERAMDEYASQNKWISVTERLPEINVNVLGVQVEEDSIYKYDVEIVRLTEDGTWYKPWEIAKVTHWQKLPENPAS